MNHKSLISALACICTLLFSSAVAAQINDNSSGQTIVVPKRKPDMFESDIMRRETTLETAPANTPTPPAGDEDKPVKTFMEGYCDPAFVPILSNNRKYFGQEGCLKSVRDNVCGRFKVLPKEVQTVLDDAIGCLFTNGNGYAVDKYQKVANDSVACGRGYMLRMDQLKKYTFDYFISNALLFMPDDVLDTQGRCVNSN